MVAAWHVAVSRGYIEILEKLWLWTGEVQPNADQMKRKLLLDQITDGKTAWNLAVRYGKIMVLQKLLDLAKDLQINSGEIRNTLLLDQENDGRPAWFLVVKSGNVKVLEKLWVLAKEKGNLEEIKPKLLLAQNEQWADCFAHGSRRECGGTGETVDFCYGSRTKQI